jgi:hypothetical protein
MVKGYLSKALEEFDKFERKNYYVGELKVVINRASLMKTIKIDYIAIKSNEISQLLGNFIIYTKRNELSE